MELFSLELHMKVQFAKTIQLSQSTKPYNSSISLSPLTLSSFRSLHLLVRFLCRIVSCHFQLPWLEDNTFFKCFVLYQQNYPYKNHGSLTYSTFFTWTSLPVAYEQLWSMIFLFPILGRVKLVISSSTWKTQWLLFALKLKYSVQPFEGIITFRMKYRYCLIASELLGRFSSWQKWWQ